MANDEHLAILKKGVGAWNAWRKENPAMSPNLRGADLKVADLESANLMDAHLGEADLIGANLIGANLVRADLAGGNLRGTNFAGACLAGANLVRADLVGANFGDANLSRADLEDADLRGANLWAANLWGVNFRGVTLTGVTLGFTSISDVDLSVVKGLKEVDHDGPSSVGVDTLSNSRGKIPEDFLRGCGLTDWEIQAAKLYDPTLTHEDVNDLIYEVFELKTTSPIVLHHVFISYSHGDTPFVEKLERGLDKKRIRYWRDVHDMKAGRMEKQIERAIRVNPLVLLVLSKHSVKSDWVQWEARKARELEQTEKRDVLCPITLDDAWKTCDWPERLRDQIMEYNVLDFSDPEAFDEQFEKLVGGIVENYP